MRLLRWRQNRLTESKASIMAIWVLSAPLYYYCNEDKIDGQGGHVQRDRFQRWPGNQRPLLTPSPTFNPQTEKAVMFPSDVQLIIFDIWAFINITFTETLQSSCCCYRCCCISSCLKCEMKLEQDMIFLTLFWWIFLISFFKIEGKNTVVLQLEIVGDLRVYNYYLQTKKKKI